MIAPLTTRFVGEGVLVTVIVAVLTVVTVLATGHDAAGGADVVVAVVAAAGQRHEQALDTRPVPQEVDT